MRLADFISTNMEAILAGWVEFAAASGPAGRTMDTTALRDHAVGILKTIALDLQSTQTPREQIEKSRGNAPDDGGPATAAEVHGAVRAESGFTLGEMVSEYRALRASVLRLWTKAGGSLERHDIGDLIRFNEAIDQGAAESIERFMHDLDRSKEMFVAILGHDLRSPLNAIIVSSQLMLERGNLHEADVALETGTLHSAQRMNQLVGDLLDLATTRLGGRLPITLSPIDLEMLAREAIREAAAANPATQLHLDTSGETRGSWDAARVSQVLANLLANAVQYGAKDEPVTVTIKGEVKEVLVSVHNRGPAIPPSEVLRIFDPVKRLTDGRGASSAGNLGLGLYIADRIATAHGGTIDVRSSALEGTLFTLHLPR